MVESKFNPKEFGSEVPKLTKNIAKKTGAIILIGGMVFFMPKTALVMTYFAPILAVRTVGQTFMNVGEIALDTCKLVKLLA